jgi:excisionase family DNA binding protein
MAPRDRLNRPESAGGELLTVKQVAERLQVSSSAVYQLLDAGRLACHRIGTGRGAIRVSESDLESFLAACRQERQEPMAAAPRVKLRHLKS